MAQLPENDSTSDTPAGDGNSGTTRLPPQFLLSANGQAGGGPGLLLMPGGCFPSPTTDAAAPSANDSNPMWPFPPPMDKNYRHPSPGLFPFPSPTGAGNGLLPIPRDTGLPQQQQSPLMYPGPNPNLLHPGAPMVAGFVSPALGPADWQTQFMHAAHLQKVTTGFLSPAGHPFVPMNGGQNRQAKGESKEVETCLTPSTGTNSGAKRTDEATDFNTYKGDTNSSWYGFPLNNGADKPTTNSDDLMNVMLHARSLSEQLLRELGLDKTVEVLQAALVLLGRPPADNEGRQDNDVNSAKPLPSVKLVHPDDFKNPSTFLKIYGDPLCFAKTGPLPKKDRNGNWECSKCHNVNFPRRFRCNMCTTTRDAEGDWVVSEYARQVYERYLYLYRSQRTRGNDISVPVPDVQQTKRSAGYDENASLNQYTYENNNDYVPNSNNRRRKNQNKTNSYKQNQIQQPQSSEQQLQQPAGNSDDGTSPEDFYPPVVADKHPAQKGFQSAVY